MSAPDAREADGATPAQTAPKAATGGLGDIPASVWRVAAVIVFGAFMANLDTSLVNVGLQTVSRRLSASLASTQWISSGYLIALAGALPAGAWLGRRVGVGRLWLGSLAAFTVASGLCAAAPSIGWLIALRVAQGVAGGLLVPAGQTVLGGVAGPSRMGRVMNTVGIAVVLAPAIGPTLGGLLIAHLSWRWLFLINLPVGAVALALGARVVPRGETSDVAPFDATGFVLLAGGLPLLTYGVITASQHGHLTTLSAVATALGVGALIAFALQARRRPDPLLDVGLFSNRVFAIAAVSVFFSGAALFGGLIVLPLYFEAIRHESVVTTGLLLTAYGLGAALSLPAGGMLTDRLGGGITAVGGLALTVATTVPLALLTAHASLAAIEALQFARGVGLGLSGLPALSSAYASVTREQLPDAAAQANILQRIGGALGSALFVVLLQRGGAPTIGTFQSTCWWLTGAALLALAVAALLALEQRRARTGRAPHV